MQLSISLVVAAVFPFLASGAGPFGTVWAILVDEEMPNALTKLFGPLVPNPKFLLVVSTSTQYYYDIFGVQSTAGDISQSLSIAWDRHEYIGSLNYLQLMTLLSAAAGFAGLAMPWFEAIVRGNDTRDEYGCTITVRDYRAAEIWWQLKRPCVSMAKPYLKNLLDLHIPPPFAYNGRVNFKSYTGYFQAGGPTIPVYCPQKSKHPRDELHAMRLSWGLSRRLRRAIRDAFDELYEEDWETGEWLTYEEQKDFSITQCRGSKL